MGLTPLSNIVLLGVVLLLLGPPARGSVSGSAPVNRSPSAISVEAPAQVIVANFSFVSPCGDGCHRYALIQEGGNLVCTNIFWLVATAIAGAPPYSYRWAFPNGSTGVGSNVTFSAILGSANMVTLNASDSHGLSSSVSRGWSDVECGTGPPAVPGTSLPGPSSGHPGPPEWLLLTLATTIGVVALVLVIAVYRRR